MKPRPWELQKLILQVLFQDLIKQEKRQHRAMQMWESRNVKCRASSTAPPSFWGE